MWLRGLSKRLQGKFFKVETAAGGAVIDFNRLSEFLCTTFVLIGESKRCLPLEP